MLPRPWRGAADYPHRAASDRPTLKGPNWPWPAGRWCHKPREDTRPPTPGAQSGCPHRLPAVQACDEDLARAVQTALTIDDLRAPATALLVTPSLEEADTQDLRFATVHRRHDGSMFPVEVHCVGIAIGGERLFVSMLHVHEIVAAHGGQLTVQSTEGQGTTFTLTLPRAAAAGPPPPARSDNKYREC